MKAELSARLRRRRRDECVRDRLRMMLVGICSKSIWALGSSALSYSTLILQKDLKKVFAESRSLWGMTSYLKKT